jgi:hypothetical protein
MPECPPLFRRDPKLSELAKDEVKEAHKNLELLEFPFNLLIPKLNASFNLSTLVNSTQTALHLLRPAMDLHTPSPLSSSPQAVAVVPPLCSC